MKRRSVLKGAGVVTILLAGGQIWRLYGQDAAEIGKGPAFEPWRSWERDAREGPLALVHAAILSANAFNSQPWLFTVGAPKIEIYADTKRNLGAFDPYRREMFFSLGCALENLCVAAPANAFHAAVSLVPGRLEPVHNMQKPELAARVELSDGPRTSSELFDAIPHRHTNRSPFDADRAVPSEFVDSLANLVREYKDVRVFLFTKESDRKTIADLIWDTSKTLVSDPVVRRNMEAWDRMTMDQVQNYRDGVYVGEPVPKSTKGAPLSYRDLMLTGRLFGTIAVRDRYDRAQTMRAGRIWQRAHLFATAHNLAARPANGAVEIIDHERWSNMEPLALKKLAQVTGDAAWQPTFMFYMGYAKVAAVASARRSMHDVLL